MERDLHTGIQQYQDAQQGLAQAENSLNTAQFAQRQATVAQQILQERIDLAQKAVVAAQANGSRRPAAMVSQDLVMAQLMNSDMQAVVRQCATNLSYWQNVVSAHTAALQRLQVQTQERTAQDLSWAASARHNALVVCMSARWQRCDVGCTAIGLTRRDAGRA